MVDKQVVLETIKKMYESGIEDSVVEQTLRDIGLNDSEIRQYLAEAKGIPLEQAQPQRPPSPSYAMRQASTMRQEAGQHNEEQSAMHATTHAALEAQAARSEEMLEKIASLEQKLAQPGQGSLSPEYLAGINQRIGTMEKKLTDMKAELTATKSIMEKILETDRKVLNKL